MLDDQGNIKTMAAQVEIPVLDSERDLPAHKQEDEQAPAIPGHGKEQLDQPQTICLQKPNKQPPPDSNAAPDALAADKAETPDASAVDAAVAPQVKTTPAITPKNVLSTHANNTGGSDMSDAVYKDDKNENKGNKGDHFSLLSEFLTVAQILAVPAALWGVSRVAPTFDYPGIFGDVVTGAAQFAKSAMNDGSDKLASFLTGFAATFQFLKSASELIPISNPSASGAANFMGSWAQLYIASRLAHPAAGNLFSAFFGPNRWNNAKRFFVKSLKGTAAIALALATSGFMSKAYDEAVNVVKHAQPAVAVAAKEGKPANFQATREATNDDYPAGFHCTPPTGKLIPNMYSSGSNSNTPETLQTDGKMVVTVKKYQEAIDPNSGQPKIYPVIEVTRPQASAAFIGFSRAVDIQSMCALKQG